MSRLFTDVADLTGYEANIHTRLLSVIACGFPTVVLDRGASSFATALHIRERYAKFLNYFVCHFYFRVGRGFEQNPGIDASQIQDIEEHRNS